MKRSTTGLATAAVLSLVVGLPMAGAMAEPTATPQAGDNNRAPGLAADEQATLHGSVTLPNGKTITRYDRTYKGLKVVGGRYAVERAAGQSMAAGQVVKKDIHLDSTTPGLTAAAAKAKVPTAVVLKGTKLTKQSADLVVYLDRNGASHLAYDVYTEGAAPNKLDVKRHVYVDANSGAILGTGSDAMAGQGDGVYDKSVTFGTVQTSNGWTFQDSHNNRTVDLQRRDSTYGYKLYDADNYWGGSNWTQAQAVDAQKGIEVTYNFYQNTYNRAGIWNTGQGVEAQVRWQNCFTNAQWTGQVIQLGEGYNCNYPLTQLDIMAHEMAHGVT